MDYIQNTAADVAEMLRSIGAGRIEDLFAQIPEDIRLGRPLDLPPALAEAPLRSHVVSLAARNRVFEPGRSFLGGGMYRRFIPAVVDEISSRGEFATSYTPYQAEASQGTLQHIFEFQSMICELTGMDVSNASHYDGATALQEAVAMAIDLTGRKKVVISGAINPQYRAVIRTLFRFHDAAIVEVAHVRGITPVSTLREAAQGAACIAVQNPNFFGCIEDMKGVADAARQTGAAAVASVDPVSLAILEAPGRLGFDIVAGEAQPLGIPTGFGGPGCGFMAARAGLIRRLPGRIVGRTVDADGRRGFVLTLQTREQHIRREKAASNICTNQTLMALRAAIALAALGPSGLRRAAELSVLRAHELAEKMARVPAIKIAFAAPFFHEFVAEIPRARETAALLLERGFLPGLPLKPIYAGLRDHMLLCCTECHDASDLDEFVSALSDCVKKAIA